MFVALVASPFDQDHRKVTETTTTMKSDSETATQQTVSFHRSFIFCCYWSMSVEQRNYITEMAIREN